MRSNLTRNNDLSPWWQRNGIDVRGSADALVAIKSPKTMSIQSMQAEGAAARSAIELSQFIFTTINSFARTGKVT